jgi:hypothetical protein
VQLDTSGSVHEGNLVTATVTPSQLFHVHAQHPADRQSAQRVLHSVRCIELVSTSIVVSLIARLGLDVSDGGRSRRQDGAGGLAYAVVLV